MNREVKNEKQNRIPGGSEARMPIIRPTPGFKMGKRLVTGFPGITLDFQVGGIF